MESLISLLIGYALGSIPFGLLLARAFGEGDIRKIGSGNIGATNVLRTGRKGLAAATLLLDAFKGFAAVAIVQIAWNPETAPYAGLGAFLGHLYPVWLRFKGGKGVATYLGIALAFSGFAALAFALTWLASAFITRFSSLSALLAALTTPLAMWVFAPWSAAVLMAVLSLAIYWSHRENIARLLAGTESRIGEKKPKDGNTA